MFLSNKDIPEIILTIYLMIAIITVALLIYLIIKRIGEVDDFEHRDN